MGEYSKALQLLEQSLEALREAKPEERSEQARYYQVAITELEKVVAYFKVYVEFAEE